MKDIIKQQNQQINIWLEPEAITTLHNLLRSKELIDRLQLETQELYIFCDRARFIKVYLLAQIIFKNTNIKVIRFGRQEPYIIYLIQIPSTILQILGAFFPKIEKKLLQNKQNWIDKYRS